MPQPPSKKALGISKEPAAHSPIQAVLDAAADAVISTGGDKLIQSFNSGAEKLFGYQAEEMIGQPVEKLFAPAWRLPANSFLDMLLSKDGDHESLKVGESLALHHSGTEFPLFLRLSMVQSSDQKILFLVIGDISARKKAELRLNRSAASQKVLNQLLRLSLSPGELDELLAQALEAIFEFPWMSSVAKGAIFLQDGQGDQELLLAAQHGLEPADLNSFTRSGAIQSFCGIEPELPGLEVCSAVNGNHAITYCSQPPQAFYNLPILSGERCLGMIVLYVVQGQRGSHEQVAFLEAVSHTLAGLIEMRLSADALKKSEADLRVKQERLDEDLKAAADIQHTFLPQSLPELNQAHLDWKFVPNQHIGGDIFNAYLLDERHLVMYMVDVSGHGVSSGLVTVSVHEMLAPQGGNVTHSEPDGNLIPVEPKEVLDLLSDEYPVERFNKTFSIVYLVLDLLDGRLSYASAGHPAPMLIKSGGEIVPLEATGPIIGLGALLPFDQAEYRLAPGDKLLLYTDGVVEYEDRSGDFYGEDRFFELLTRQRAEPMEAVLAAVWDSMMEFGQKAAPRDDVSLLGLSYLGG